MSADTELSAPLPAAEAERMQAVRRYDVLDTPPDGAFDRIAALAARIFDVPIATVTIVDHDRIWFKAAHGIDVDEVTRDPGLCASAILQSDPYVVADAIDDPRCLDNPLVRGELGVRFYAAAPIRTPDGHNLGTVNVISGQPRTVTTEELGVLQYLADIVADELEVRLEARRTVASERIQRRRAEHLIDVLQRRLLPQRPVRIPSLEVATYYRPVATTELDIGGDFIDVFDIDDTHWALAIGDVCGKGPEAAAATGEIRAALRAIARIQSNPRDVLVRLNDVLCRDGFDSEGADAVSELFCTASLLRTEQVDEQMALTVANAGHPLPLVRRTDGTVTTIGEPGQLLGAFPDIDVPEVTATLQTGDMVLLYTDGAVEQHGKSITEGEATLTHALRSAPSSSADAALAHVRDAVQQLHHSFTDDIALVLARVVSSEPPATEP